MIAYAYQDPRDWLQKNTLRARAVPQFEEARRVLKNAHSRAMGARPDRARIGRLYLGIEGGERDLARQVGLLRKARVESSREK